MERLYAKDGKTYATVEGRTEDGKTVLCVYYNGWFAKLETHKVNYYAWATRLHGNAPGGTPYGYYRLNRGGRIVLTT